ncbi:MAG TPA: hypothetical protein PLS29_01810 [Acidimicrobiales bacterium]|nr:MAG: hypothetical protein B7Z69_03325 [Actinobacteria bacterium 21-73-9]HQU25747.1 hypothetical protein [Acidimicrobiales bacterium]
MPRRPLVTRVGPVVRTRAWNGLRDGDSVVVNDARVRARAWVFVAHALNESTGEEWVEVRGGRPGEAKGRAFAPERIFPVSVRRGRRVVGPSIADAPRLDLAN